VFLFDETGRLIREFGGPGEGPAEFKYPYALAAFGGSFVVLSLGPSKVFSVFDTLAGFQKSSPPPLSGDWDRIIFRSPIARDGRQQVPMSEDITSRISEFGEDRFLHSIRLDERTFLEDSVSQGRFVPNETLVVYGPDLLPLDTISTLRGPPTETNDRLQSALGPWTQLIWAPRSIWVGRDRVYAIHQPGEGRAIVFDSKGELILDLQWSPKTVPLSEKHRVQITDWIWFRDSTATPPARLHTLPGKSEKESIAERLARTLSFSDVLPEIAWLGLSQGCLLVSPFGATSNIQGVSLTMLVVDLENRNPLGLIKLGSPGARIRTAGKGGIWVSFHDDGAAMVLRRFPLPFPECAGGLSDQ